MPDPDFYTTIPTDRVLITAKFFHILLAVLLAYSVGAVWLCVYLVGPLSPCGPPRLGFGSPAPPPTLEQLQSGTTTSLTSKHTWMELQCYTTRTAATISQEGIPLACRELQ